MVLLGAAHLRPSAVPKIIPVMQQYWYNGVAPGLEAGISIQDPTDGLMCVPGHLVGRDDLNRHLQTSDPVVVCSFHIWIAQVAPDSLTMGDKTEWELCHRE